MAKVRKLTPVSCLPGEHEWVYSLPLGLERVCNFCDDFQGMVEGLSGEEEWDLLGKLPEGASVKGIEDWLIPSSEHNGGIWRW